MKYKELMYYALYKLDKTTNKPYRFFSQFSEWLITVCTNTLWNSVISKCEEH